MTTHHPIASKDTSESYPEWFLDIGISGELYEESPTPGCYTFLPKSVDIWDRIRKEVDRRLKLRGVKNILLPSLIPLHLFDLEKSFVDGFSPELAVVTHGGGKQLERPLAVRPTSEVLFCDFFLKKLHSYNDLPLLYNQWCNVIRWEKRTRPFLRSAEFHWQEGHTLHATEQEAWLFTKDIIENVYIPVINDFLAIEGIYGKKCPSERFAGAKESLTYEPMMSNGWALQICTAHLLGDGFAKSFKLSFSNENEERKTPAYTSWGMSTRTIGGMISSHSDNKGLVIPPKLSEYEAVLISVNGKDASTVNAYAKKVVDSLGFTNIPNHLKLSDSKYIDLRTNDGSAILFDNRDLRLGEKLIDFERSGYPLAIIIGANEATSEMVEVYCRITGNKSKVSINALSETITETLDTAQNELLQRSKDRLRNNIVCCQTFNDIKNVLGDERESEFHKFVLYNWDGSTGFEALLKDELKAVIRCIPNENSFVRDLMPVELGKELVVIARSF